MPGSGQLTTAFVLCLPLHHVHGIINVVSCALWSGAVCEMMPRFDAEAIWKRIGRGELTLFMAVPTIYFKLITAWESYSPDRQAIYRGGARKLRLMVSGSAALPVSTLERWREITGHTLLERYGMTEIGMALSNPYRGERIPGTVGKPLPQVEVRLVDDIGTEVAAGTPGEIEVRGPTVFQEYWQQAGGDTRSISRWLVSHRRHGCGRERRLSHPGPHQHRHSEDGRPQGFGAGDRRDAARASRGRECAVVGLPDPEWGERVGAALVLNDGHSLDLEALRAWAKDRLAVHKVPSRLLLLKELPRNAMGKVTKPAVKELFGRQVS